VASAGLRYGEGDDGETEAAPAPHINSRMPTVSPSREKRRKGPLISEMKLGWRILFKAACFL